MMAIVHQLPRIDNNYVSDHSADALTAKALCDMFVWSEKAKFFLVVGQSSEYKSVGPYHTRYCSTVWYGYHADTVQYICCMVPIFISLDRKAPLQFDVLLELLMRQLAYEFVFIFG